MQVINERLVQLLTKTKRMQPIHPEQMAKFYDSADNKSSVYLYGVVTHT